MWKFDWERGRLGPKRNGGEESAGRGKPAARVQGMRMGEKLRQKGRDLFGRARGEAAGQSLQEGELHQRALQNMRRIAAGGILVIALDLAAALAGGSVPILEEDGQLYLIRPAVGQEPGHISLRATVRSGPDTIQEKMEVRLEPGQDSSQREGAQESEAGRRQPSPQELVRSEFRAIAAGFNEDIASRRVPLPQRLDSGEKIDWQRSRDTNTLLLVLLTGGLMLVVYHSRLQPLRKQEEARRQSVTRQLPVFLNELVLLMNAGLVLSRAFQVAVKQMPQAGDDYFRQNLAQILHSMHHTNGVMHEELQDFARESGVSELMRVSGVITDNINKGTELARKLQRESESLWLARKLRAEEQGRLAETKMTLPLSIFLCVLIVITVAPALLQL